MIPYVIILIAVVIIGAITIFLVNKAPKIRIPLQIIFAAAIVILSWLLVKNINKPINFEKETDLRFNTAKTKLIDIRTIQESYKDKYGKYTGSFDTLISFVSADSFAIEDIREVTPGAWNQDDMSRSEAIKKGILVKKTSYVHIADSLWKNKTYPIENIRYIPFTNNTKEFELAAGEIVTASKVKVKVFECYALYNVLYEGLDEQLIVNYIDTKTKYGGFDGIKVGSLSETNNNAGNWEK